MLLSVYVSYFKPRRDPLNKAEELARQNKYLEAITEYKKLLYANPDAFDIHFRIADLYKKQEDYIQVIYHLNEILRIDRYNLEIQKLAVLKKLAQAYHYVEDIEKVFRTYFDILKLDSELPEAYYHISFIALGQEEFEIAQPYFEKLVKVQDDFESFFGAGICSYQNSKNEDAVAFFREALTLKPNSDISILALSFALQRIRKQSEAISYLNKLAFRITEESVKYIARRLLAFLNIQINKSDEAIKLFEDLLTFTKESQMHDELKLTLYDIGFACVKNRLLDQAYKYWDQLYRLDNEYEDIINVLNLVKKEIDKGHSSDGFETTIFDYIDEWESKAFPNDFLWNICGLKSERLIDIKNIVVPAKITKVKDTGKKEVADNQSDSSDRIVNFQEADTETFRMISNRIVLKLGYKVNEILHTYREADGVDILGQSQDNNEKVLFWIRRWKGTNVGEITLRNFAQAINDNKVPKGLFLTTAELTQAAEKSLSRLSKVKVIYPNEVNELLRGLI